ncbi:ABC transporter C family member 8 [Camellia lanceoleosa]|uniref:ABC transporter C family member 8 n=1 Tax=Camellia lanceoleosa TaxID=1840588 RepID=A0ACC0HW96_9ERIC|nr:ABC transporter C family member 8 [Camellia lanceoleosa]
MEHHNEILEYFNKRGVSRYFFQEICYAGCFQVLANSYDKHAKQLNGTHKAHVHSPSLSPLLLGLKASKAFFSDFTNSILNAPMLFFDSTPVGRILTRASSDLCVVDFDIPFSFAFVVAPLIESVAIIGIMAYHVASSLCSILCYKGLQNMFV